MVIPTSTAQYSGFFMLLAGICLLRVENGGKKPVSVRKSRKVLFLQSPVSGLRAASTDAAQQSPSFSRELIGSGARGKHAPLTSTASGLLVLSSKTHT